ncbi:MAG: AMP-binding protein [SAR202 cluster bacterium]|nr:AMP-binding protein [SAR202 cluster bacterium]|tara:strand:- start:41120 stop:42247 length:1128 start_codon:yes stop_codon:yes gene_type:complete
MQENNFKNLQDSQNTGITLYTKENNKKQFKFIDLENESKKFTKVLSNLGVNSSDNIVILSDLLPQSYTAFWGCKELGNSPEIIDPKKDIDQIKEKLIFTSAKIVITTQSLRKKISQIIFHLFDLQHIIIIDDYNDNFKEIDIQDLSYNEEINKIEESFSNIDVFNTNKLENLSLIKNFIQDNESPKIWSLYKFNTPVNILFSLVAPKIFKLHQLIVINKISSNEYLDFLSKEKISIWCVYPEVLYSLINKSYIKTKIPNLNLKTIITEPGLLKINDILKIEKLLNVKIFYFWENQEINEIISANHPNQYKLGSVGKPKEKFNIKILNNNSKQKNKKEGDIALRIKTNSLHQKRVITNQKGMLDQDGFLWIKNKLT